MSQGGPPPTLCIGRPAELCVSPTGDFPLYTVGMSSGARGPASFRPGHLCFHLLWTPFQLLPPPPRERPLLDVCPCLSVAYQQFPPHVRLS